MLKHLIKKPREYPIQVRLIIVEQILTPAAVFEAQQLSRVYTRGTLIWLDVAILSLFELGVVTCGLIKFMMKQSILRVLSGTLSKRAFYGGVIIEISGFYLICGGEPWWGRSQCFLHKNVSYFLSWHYPPGKLCFNVIQRVLCNSPWGHLVLANLLKWTKSRKFDNWRGREMKETFYQKTAKTEYVWLHEQKKHKQRFNWVKKLAFENFWTCFQDQI